MKKVKNMKKLITLLTAVLMLALFSCEKEADLIISGNPLVEEYIFALKSNQYDALDMPPLTYKEIPALLEYRNDTYVINKFPRNPISSHYQRECTVGMVVIWTIESIRAVSVNSSSLFMRFPSQNPVLALRNAPQLEFALSSASHKAAAKAYYDWWYNNKNRSYNNFKRQDPLKNTNYRWH